MQISAINNNQTKPNFNAYMRVYESGSSKKLLSEEAIKALSEKLEPIGKKTDSLVVYLTQQLSEEDALKANIENDLPNYSTKISLVDNFEGKRFLPFPINFATVYGSVSDRAKKTVKLLEFHIENLGKIFNK